MTARRSARDSASSWSWVTMTAVASASRRMSSTSRLRSARSVASRLERANGSSRCRTSSGSARARARRHPLARRLRKARAAGSRAALCWRPTSSSAARAFGAAPARPSRRRSRRDRPKGDVALDREMRKSAYSWNTIPIRRRCGRAVSTCRRRLRAGRRPGPRPHSVSSNPATRRSRVVFPQPLGPSTVKSSPRAISRSTPGRPRSRRRTSPSLAGRRSWARSAIAEARS